MRERYGVAIPSDDAASLDEALLDELFGRSYGTPAQAAAAADQLPLDEQNRWNETLLPLHGIGEDCFYLNEFFTEGRTILDFDTLGAFDEDDYRFQESARRQHDPSYPGKPYRGTLYMNWARLYLDGRFTYATLSMSAGHLCARVSEVAQAMLQRRVPHRYVPGRNHGRVQGDQWQWDMRVDANGQEGIVEELQHRISQYERERYDALLTCWDQEGLSGVYLLDQSETPEIHWHFIFTDARALAAVRFRSFVRDCRAMQRPIDELSRAVAEEEAALERFIDEQHADIVRNHDPKIRKFRKRCQIMVMRGALDDFE
jgi:hypothetical protein